MGFPGFRQNDGSSFFVQFYTGKVPFERFLLWVFSNVERKCIIKTFLQETGGSEKMFILLGGGLLIILFAVIVAVVSSVVSAVAADQDVED